MTLPLDGILIVDFSQFLSGPLCSLKLADLGARVIKIERAEGDFARGYDTAAGGQSSYFVWPNRGKESLVADIKNPADAAMLHAILARADVFIQNLAPGAAERANSERLMRLPVPAWCWTPPADSPVSGPPPLVRLGTPTFGSFNHAMKLTDATLAMWRALFALLPAARYVMETQRAVVDYAFVSTGLPLIDYFQAVAPGAWTLWSPQYVGLARLLFAAMALLAAAAGAPGRPVHAVLRNVFLLREGAEGLLVWLVDLFALLLEVVDDLGFLGDVARGVLGHGLVLSLIHI